MAPLRFVYRIVPLHMTWRRMTFRYNVLYSTKSVLLKKKTFSIIREDSKHSRGQQETRYGLYKNNKLLAWIKGYYEKDHFYILRMEVAKKGKGYGKKYLPKVFNALRQDVKKHSLNTIQAQIVPWLWPKVKRLYPFTARKDLLRKVWFLNIPVTYKIP